VRVGVRKKGRISWDSASRRKGTRLYNQVSKALANHPRKAGDFSHNRRLVFFGNNQGRRASSLPKEPSRPWRVTCAALGKVVLRQAGQAHLDKGS
jgi:hypothetical protein